MAYKLNVNGKVMEADVDRRHAAALDASRHAWGSPGRSSAAASAQCGACTVHIDGKADAQLRHAGLRGGRRPRSPPSRRWQSHPIGKKVQAAWMDLDVAQCGYCQPGQIMAATALLAQDAQAHRRRHRPGDDQHLPLRHLHAHPRGHQTGLRPAQ